MHNTAGIFDTLSYAKRLKKAGFTEEQAEVQAETFLIIVEDHLVTKRDLKELEVALRRDMEIMRRDMKIWFGSLLIIGVATLGTLVAMVTALAK